MIIRPELPDDAAGIRAILRADLAGDHEADLLRRDGGDLLLSRVADLLGRTVGHVGFSRLWVRPGGGRGLPASALPRIAGGAVWVRRSLPPAITVCGPPARSASLCPATRPVVAASAARLRRPRSIASMWEGIFRARSSAPAAGTIGHAAAFGSPP